MGQRIETKISQNPGPADYKIDETITQTSAQKVVIGNAERQELWS